MTRDRPTVWHDPAQPRLQGDAPQLLMDVLKLLRTKLDETPHAVDTWHGAMEPQAKPWAGWTRLEVRGRYECPCGGRRTFYVVHMVVDAFVQHAGPIAAAHIAETLHYAIIAEIESHLKGEDHDEDAGQVAHPRTDPPHA